MKDLNLTRIINVVAAGGVLLTVGGCGTSEERVARQVCKAQRECARAEFVDEYDNDLKECVEDYEDMFDYFDEVSDSCSDAYLKYLSCAAKEMKASCDYDEVEDKCEDRYDDMIDECEGEYVSGPTAGDGDYDDYYDY